MDDCWAIACLLGLENVDGCEFDYSQVPEW